MAQEALKSAVANAQHKDPNGTLHCITLDPATEDYLQGNIQRLEHGSNLICVTGHHEASTPKSDGHHIP